MSTFIVAGVDNLHVWLLLLKRRKTRKWKERTQKHIESHQRTAS